MIRFGNETVHAREGVADRIGYAAQVIRDARARSRGEGGHEQRNGGSSIVRGAMGNEFQVAESDCRARRYGGEAASRQVRALSERSRGCVKLPSPPACRYARSAAVVLVLVRDYAVRDGLGLTPTPRMRCASVGGGKPASVSMRTSPHSTT